MSVSQPSSLSASIFLPPSLSFPPYLQPPWLASESVHTDEVYERAVNNATVVYQLEGVDDKAKFVPVHDHSAQMLKVAVLSTEKVFNS